MVQVDLIPAAYGVLLLVIFGFQSVYAQAEGDLRLAGGNSSQGRVEIFHDGQWGTVCDDKFERPDAIVVCRQLGFPPTGAQPTKQFGPGTGPIWMDELKCTGTGQRLDQCQFRGWNESDCDHSEDIGVICPTSPVTTVVPAETTTTESPVGPDAGKCTIPDPSVRLVGPSSRPGMGVVQIFNFTENQWGTICDDSWDLNDAKVICRMLCYNTDEALPGSPPFNTNNITEPMMLKSVDCTGQETSINDCPQSAWVANSCTATEKALVTCVQLDDTAPSKPQPVLECTGGKLKTSFSTLRDRYLEPKHLTLANTNFTGPCNITYQNGTNYLAISIPFEECGTTRTYNGTHIIYNTTINYAPSHSTGAISTRKNTYMVLVKCALPRSAVIADKPIRPLTETVTQAATGEFIVNMHFFRNSFQSEVTKFPLEIPLGDFLTSGISLQRVDKNLQLIIPNCFATPSPNRDHQVRYPLFTNKCPNDSSVGFFPLNDTFFGYRYQTFKFLEYPDVYIHCDAIVCGKDEGTPECDQSCFPSSQASAAGNSRRKRSYSNRVVYLSSPLIIVYDPTNPTEIIREPQHTTKMATTTKKNTVFTTKKHTSPSVSDTTLPGITDSVTQHTQLPVGDFILGTSGSSSLTYFTVVCCLCGLTNLLALIL